MMRVSRTKDCVSMHVICGLLVGLLATLGLAMAGPVYPKSTNLQLAVTLQGAELDALCAGEADGIKPHPAGCQHYMFCCGGKAFMRQCRHCPNDRPVCEYGPWWLSAYDEQAAACYHLLEPSSLDDCKPDLSLHTRESYQSVVFCGHVVKNERQRLNRLQQSAEAAQAGMRPSVLHRSNLQVPSMSALGGSFYTCPMNHNPPNLSYTGNYELILNDIHGNSSTGMSLTHIVLVPGTTKILGFGRHQPMEDHEEPGIHNPGGVEYDVATGTYNQLEMVEYPFCAGHSHLFNDTILVTGGEMDGAEAYPEAPAPYFKEGRNAIRTYDRATKEFKTLPLKLAGAHWYPSQIVLPDERVLIVGGYESIWGPPNTMVEIFHPATQQLTVLPNIDFTTWVEWNNLYAHMYRLPHTGIDPSLHYLVGWACKQGQIMAVNQQDQIAKVVNLPPLPDPNACSAFSAAGTSLLLALKPEDNYAATLMLFGGYVKYREPQPGDPTCMCDVPALKQSWRMSMNIDQLLAGNITAWEVEEMPMARNQGAAVLLPNGKVVLLNGNQFGLAGGGVIGGGMARAPAYRSVLYDPDLPVGQRYRFLATSNIKRLYHASALLLPTGDILVAGTEQSECVPGCTIPAPLHNEYQAERLRPPYSFWPTRPSINGVIGGVAHIFGQTISVHYTGTVTGASIAAPGSHTHSYDMDQRVVFLSVVTNECGPSNTGTVTLQLPTFSSRTVNPGWYMLFLLNGDAYATKASWIQILQAYAPPPPAPPSPPPKPPAPPSPPPNAIVSLDLQCGGTGGTCYPAQGDPSAGGPCVDGPWIGYQCDTAHVCTRINEYWWWVTWDCGAHQPARVCRCQQGCRVPLPPSPPSPPNQPPSAPDAPPPGPTSQLQPPSASPPPPSPRPPAPPSFPPSNTNTVVSIGMQCGGASGSCGGASSAVCADGPWVGFTCAPGLSCLRKNSWWWDCEDPAADCPCPSSEPCPAQGASIQLMLTAPGGASTTQCVVPPAYDPFLKVLSFNFCWRTACLPTQMQGVPLVATISTMVPANIAKLPSGPAAYSLLGPPAAGAVLVLSPTNTNVRDLTFSVPGNVLSVPEGGARAAAVQLSIPLGYDGRSMTLVLTSYSMLPADGQSADSPIMQISTQATVGQDLSSGNLLAQMAATLGAGARAKVTGQNVSTTIQFAYAVGRCDPAKLAAFANQAASTLGLRRDSFTVTLCRLAAVGGRRLNQDGSTNGASSVSTNYYLDGSTNLAAAIQKVKSGVICLADMACLVSASSATPTISSQVSLQVAMDMPPQDVSTAVCTQYGDVVQTRLSQFLASTGVGGGGLVQVTSSCSPALRTSFYYPPPPPDSYLAHSPPPPTSVAASKDDKKGNTNSTIIIAAVMASVGGLALGLLVMGLIMRHRQRQSTAKVDRDDGATLDSPNAQQGTNSSSPVGFRRPHNGVGPSSPGISRRLWRLTGTSREAPVGAAAAASLPVPPARDAWRTPSRTVPGPDPSLANVADAAAIAAAVTTPKDNSGPMCRVVLGPIRGSASRPGSANPNSHSANPSASSGQPSNSTTGSGMQLQVAEAPRVIAEVQVGQVERDFQYAHPLINAPMLMEPQLELEMSGGTSGPLVFDAKEDLPPDRMSHPDGGLRRGLSANARGLYAQTSTSGLLTAVPLDTDIALLQPLPSSRPSSRHLRPSWSGLDNAGRSAPLLRQSDAGGGGAWPCPSGDGGPSCRESDSGHALWPGRPSDCGSNTLLLRQSDFGK